MKTVAYLRSVIQILRDNFLGTKRYSWFYYNFKNIYRIDKGILRERGSDDCLFVEYVKIWNVSKTNKKVKNLPNTSKFVNFKTKKSPGLGYSEKHSYEKLLPLTIQTLNIFYFLGWFLPSHFYICRVAIFMRVIWKCKKRCMKDILIFSIVK